MERQFLMNWKAMRKARRRRQRQTREGEFLPTAKHIPTALPVPLTMPALPARQPLKTRKQHSSLLEDDTKLPDIIPSHFPMDTLSPLKEVPEWRTVVTSYGVGFEV